MPKKIENKKETKHLFGTSEKSDFILNMTEESAVSFLTARLNEQLKAEAERLMGSDHGIPLGISTGAVRVPEYGREYEELFKAADEALYDAKKNGKHRCCVYSGDRSSKDIVVTPAEELERLSKILGERNDKKEALVLGLEPFSAVYHFIIRFNKRYGTKAVKVLFVLTRKPDSIISMDEIMNSFGEVLKKTLRRSDIILKNKTNQYLAILPMPEDPNPESMVARVMKEWKDSPGYDHCDVDHVLDDCR